MKTKPLIKLIKKEERDTAQKPRVGLADDPNSWSTAVRSWIAESQERDRTESLPAFDSLFKDALAEQE